MLRGCARGDCGGLIILSSSRDHSPREALLAPTECFAKRSVEHTPRIKHQDLNSNQPCKFEYADISLSRILFSNEAQRGTTPPASGRKLRLRIEACTHPGYRAVSREVHM